MRELTQEMIDEFLRRDAAGEPREQTFRALGVSQSWFHSRYCAAGLKWPVRLTKQGRPRRAPRLPSWTKSPADRPLGNERAINIKAREPDSWPGRYEDDPRAARDAGDLIVARAPSNRTLGGVAEY